MSGKSCASGSVRSGAGSVRLGAAVGHEVVLDALYERKRDNKSVRVLTVIIYVFCVSLAAIMLSLYYVFFWEPKDTKVFHTVEKQTSTTPMPTCFMPQTGGVNSTVREPVSEPSTADDYESSNAGPAGATNDTLDLTTAAEPSLQPHYNTTDDDSPFNHTTTNT